ncbi:hybrid sensor histidine kinase/response regulator [Flavilitoribacter nigricans]|nr:hybrid sensor histidine kinase/response regulator [Flavilitoribacter nigricans]
MRSRTTNFQAAGKPQLIQLPEELPVISPGSDLVPLPKTVLGVGRTQLAVQPPRTLAAPAEIKPEAIANFKQLSVDQGMSTMFVHAVVEDQHGNIWFGTGGGGISRFDHYSFMHFSEAEGLLYSSVHSLLIDSRDNLWIGTDGKGLSRYDGHQFTHFTDQNGLSDNAIECMMEDSKGGLWFGTANGGVNKFDPLANEGQGSFTHYTIEQGLSHNDVRAILEDSRGNIWFGTEGGGVSRFEPRANNGWGRFTHFTEESGLSSNLVYAITEDKQGNIWLGTKEGLDRYDGQSIARFTTKEGLSADYIRSLLTDSRGNLWIGTEYGGVIKYIPNAYGGLGSFTRFAFEEGFTSRRIVSIMEDHSGRFWFAVQGDGAYRYDERSFTYHYNLGSVKLENGQAKLLADYNGSLRAYDPDMHIYTRYAPEDLGSEGYFTALLEDSNGNYWLGTDSSGIIRYNPRTNESTSFTERHGLVHKQVFTIMEDSRGDLWIGSHHHGVSRYNPTRQEMTHFTESEGLANNHVHILVEDSQGYIWIGMGHGGITRYAPDQTGNGGSFTDFTTETGLTTDQVNTIMEDSKGNIWIGTWNGGINIFHPTGKGGTFTYIDKEDGLSNSIIQHITEDRQGRFWVSTEQGLNLLVPDSTAVGSDYFRIINLDREDGLKGTNIGGSLLDSENRIWWRDIMLDLREFQLPEKAPRIQLNQLELEQTFVDYRRLPNDSTYLNSILFGKHLEGTYDSVAAFYNYPLNLQLPHNINHLTFSYSAIDWVAPHKISYQFMLEGLEEGWNPVTTENKADYRSLPPGTFTFKVRAAGQTMRWSEPFAYTFTILPPWWLTWWAKAFYGLIGLVLVWTVIRSRTAALEKRQKVLEQTVREKTAEVVQQKERAERSEKIKQQFLANMSHEIRTPMNAILGMIRILRRHALLPAQRPYIDAIHQSADNLLVILNDILDLSKIEAGKIEIASVPINPVKVVENVLDILKFKAEEKGLRLNYRTEGDVPELVMGDPTRLNQILLNLIGNAIKFTDKGTIRTLICRNGESGMLRFAVEDQGIGIPADKLQTIFNSFEQVSASSTRKYGGTGLGLTITKQLVDLQKGKIWIKSEENKGSTFFFELPVRLAAGKEVAETTATEDQLKTMGNELAGMKILLAEDNAFNSMLVQDDLSYYVPGVEVDLAQNGLAALESYQANTYDLILMDVHMPEMNGYEASRHIRKLEAERQIKTPIPIIAMTASLLKSEVALCYEAGMDNYVPKPYKIEELIGTLFSMANN